MVHLLELVYFLLIVKAILRCLYFWQLKEYRLDRFSDFIKSPEAKRYFLPSRFLLRPRLTFKALLLIYLNFYFSVLILKFDHQLFALLAAYLLVPFISSLTVFLLIPLTSFFYDLIIFSAKLKLHFFYKNLVVIGITGSFGKTSTKEILAHLLAAKYRVCKTPATKNTLIGVALTILKDLKKKHQYFVVEMGAYKIGEIRKICQLVKPSVAILTGITKQHLSLFGSLEKIIKTKYELIKSLPGGGLAVFNADNAHTLELSKSTKRVKVKTYTYPKTIYQTNLIGSFQQLNIAGALTVAKYFKLPLKTIKKRLTKIPRFNSAVTVKTGFNRAIIINDSYNSNPEGFKGMIDLVKSKKAQQKILITPGIIELGKESKTIHQQIIDQAETVFDRIIFTKSLNYLESEKTQILTDYHKILKQLKSKLNSKTLVLLEGRLPEKFITALC